MSGPGVPAPGYIPYRAASTEKTIREADQGGEEFPWNRRLTLKLLREEAEAIVKKK